ncbi:MAG: hypothetical protein ACRDDM_07125 [Paraclostridium sp.]
MARSVIRKVNIKKSVSARTKGKATRSVRKVIMPNYGKKGMGWITNPKKAAYNKVYKKTSYSIIDILNLIITGKIKG